MTSVTTTEVPSRRDRLRAELVEQIKSTARAQLAEKGPSGVSWRGIAREVGVSPAALYTYFESLDDLYTALITDSFLSLADAVRHSIELFSDHNVSDRLTAGIAGYREWSLRFSEEFRLIFQSEIPGYEAPEGGETVSANLQSSAQFLVLLVEGWERGELTEPGPGVPVDPTEMNEKFGIDLTPDQMRVALAAWGTFHGIVQLEVNDHIESHWVDNDQLFMAVVQELGSSCGGHESRPEVFDEVRAFFDRQWPDRPRRISAPCAESIS
jgi:AcrR family transcriptional regulator